MNDFGHLIDSNPAIYGPIVFVCMWLSVTTLLWLLSGWRARPRGAGRNPGHFLWSRVATGSAGR